MTQKTKILCVEDEELILGDLVEELEDAGYETISAHNGKEALKKLSEVKPDAILCDIMMPDMDGPTFLKQVRKTMPELDRVPFIFLTARASREDIIAGKRMGADDYLTKPIDYDMLLATLDARLGEVARMAESTRKELKALYEAFEKQKPATRSGPIRVAIVTDTPGPIAPLSAALRELGCVVEQIPESALKTKSFSTDHADVSFFVYSKVVHYWLKYLAGEIHSDKLAKVVLLVPPKLNPNLMEALLEIGVDRYIEFPYRPVEVFKVILDRIAQGSAFTPAKARKKAPAEDAPAPAKAAQGA